MQPTRVEPPDYQIVGDDWTCRINLDVTKDWSSSTFTLDTVPAVTATVDATHKADLAPYVLLHATSAALAGVERFHWNLFENHVLNFTFLSRLVNLVAR